MARTLIVVGKQAGGQRTAQIDPRIDRTRPQQPATSKGGRK